MGKLHTLSNYSKVHYYYAYVCHVPMHTPIEAPVPVFNFV